MNCLSSPASALQPKGCAARLLAASASCLSVPIRMTSTSSLPSTRKTLRGVAQSPPLESIICLIMWEALAWTLDTATDAQTILCDIIAAPPGSVPSSPRMRRASSAPWTLTSRRLCLAVAALGLMLVLCAIDTPAFHALAAPVRQAADGALKLSCPSGTSPRRARPGSCRRAP